jgi:hypothetical protein
MDWCDPAHCYSLNFNRFCVLYVRQVGVRIRLLCIRLVCNKLVCNRLVCDKLVCNKLLCIRLLCNKLLYNKVQEVANGKGAK